MEQRNYSDKKYALKKIAQLIKSNPLEVENALKHSNVFIEKPLSKRELAEKVAYNLAHNRNFPKNIGLSLYRAELSKLNPSERFNNLGGRGEVDFREQASQSAQKIGQGVAGGKDPITMIIGAIAGTIDAAFGIGTAKKRAKADEERYRQELIGELFEEEKKTNWIPIYIVAGVLVVGGIVTYFALKK